MDSTNQHPRLGLTFNDILLVPGYADFLRSDINISTNLTSKIKLSIPFVAAPMDTVTESKLAISLAKLGGIGIIHRNLTIANQVEEVLKVKKEKLLVGAAVGASKGFEDRVEALINAKVDVIVVDSAHGFSKGVVDATRSIKKKFAEIDVIAGNVATYDGAKAMIEAGADAIRVGMGPGAICTTRVISGMGVPQITAIQETVRAAKQKGIPVIADGGITYSGDMVKALAVGASAVMMGSFFASCEEAPGEIVVLNTEQVPSRFKSITNKDQETYNFKYYRAMGSIGAMKEGARIKSEDEFHGKSYNDRVLVAEGVESLIPLKGSVKDVLDQAVGGIKSGMYYVGAQNILDLQQKSEFIQITQSSLTESHPHDVLIINPGKNY